MAEASKPTIKFEAFPLQLSVWENEGKDGKVYFSFRIQKAYKSKEGQWRHTDALDLQSLPMAAALLQRAWMELGTKKLTQEDLQGDADR